MKLYWVWKTKEQTSATDPTPASTRQRKRKVILGVALDTLYDCCDEMHARSNEWILSVKTTDYIRIQMM